MYASMSSGQQESNHGRFMNLKMIRWEVRFGMRYEFCVIMLFSPKPRETSLVIRNKNFWLKTELDRASFWDRSID